MNHFVYRLIPPRPTFGPDTMTEQEAATMADHTAYWSTLVATGRAIVFGPVMDPSGTWGLAVVQADAEADVRAIRERDPAIAGGLCTADILHMPVAITAPATT